MENKELSTVVMMTAAEAQKAHQLVGKIGDGAARQMGAVFYEMHFREGYRAMGCKTFGDYTKLVEKDYGISRNSVYRGIALVRVEGALNLATGKRVELPVQHAELLAPLLELKNEQQPQQMIAEAYKEAGGNEGALRRIVGRLLAKLHPKSKTKAQKERGADGWTKEDLDDDKELRDALDKIEHVYGREDRKAIQIGAVGLPRKDIVTLAKLYAPTMEKLQYLIMSKHWGVDQSLKFANDMADERSTVEELCNWCLTTKGLYWTGTFGGFEISVKATTAVKKKL